MSDEGLEKTFRINEFKGINLSTDPSNLLDSESPNMMNMEIDSKGILRKRKGYKKLCETNKNSNIRAFYTFYKNNTTPTTLLVISDKLYRFRNGNVLDLLYTGLNAGHKTTFFTMKDKCYILGGNVYLEYDGSKISEVVPYVPTVTMSMAADGSGTTHEDLNLIGTQFKCSYSPNGTDKVFQLTKVSPGDLSSGFWCKASVDGGVTWTIQEGSGMTVNKSTWKVTFDTAPIKGTNTLIIEAAIMVADISKIFMCTLAEIYGGDNDTRILLSGNFGFPNRIFRSGLYDATYYPMNGFTDVGSTNEAVKGMVKQYDSLVILKYKSIYLMNFDLNNGAPIFRTRPLNDNFGCVSSDSIQIIDNMPIWLSDKGVCILTQTNVRDERNVTIVSENVNSKLLSEEYKGVAISIDYKNKYILAIKNTWYVFDYKQNIWYVWDVTSPTFFSYYNDYKDLIFGGSAGIIYKMRTVPETIVDLINGTETIDKNLYMDDTQPINAFWYSKELDFGLPYIKKNLKKIFLTAIPSVHDGIESTVDLFRYLDKNNVFISSNVIDKTKNLMAKGIRIKTKAKKLQRYQIKIANGEPNQSLSISDIGFEYLPTNFIK